MVNRFTTGEVPYQWVEQRKLICHSPAGEQCYLIVREAYSSDGGLVLIEDMVDSVEVIVQVQVRIVQFVQLLTAIDGLLE